MTNLRVVRLSTLAVFVSLLNHSLFAQPTATTGGIQITVTNEQGQPIGGATVEYERQPKTVVIGGTEVPAPGESTLSGSAVTDDNGQMNAAGLPPGYYALCANVPGVAYLDPCVWQQGGLVAVVAGQVTTSTMTLTKGVFLDVSVADPAGLLPVTPRQIWDGPKLLVGVVYGNGAYQAAPEPAINGATRSYQMAIPAGTDFWLRLYSTDVSLNDETGAAVDTSGSRIPFHTSPGQDVTYSFAVSGAMPQ